MYKRLSIEYISKKASVDYNLTLLSSKYVNNHSKLDWKDNKTGIVFSRSWHNIQSGYTSTNTINNYELDKSTIESYKGLGYTYNKDYASYMSESKKKGSRVFTIEHPLLPEPWVTTMDNFKRNAEKYINKTTMSYGEKVIYYILKNSKIGFKYQYSVHIGGNLHIFDFYLPDYNMYIEYDGRQHFESIDYWGGEKSLENRKIRDKEKDDYVTSVGATIIRIPYTYDTSDSILLFLSPKIDKLLEMPVIGNHTIYTNTCTVCGNNIDVGNKYCSRECYATDRKKNPPVSKEKLDSLITKYGFSKAGRILGVSDNGVRLWCKKYGMSLKIKDYK